MKTTLNSLYYLLPLMFLALFASCDDENDNTRLFSNMRYSIDDLGVENATGEWNEWATRYMWNTKGLVDVRYDSNKGEYIVEGEQLKKYGFTVTKKEYKLEIKGQIDITLPKEENFQIYAVGDLYCDREGDWFRVFDGFVWSAKDCKFPKTKEEGKDKNGMFSNWKLYVTEEELWNTWLTGLHPWEGQEEWYAAYQDTDFKKEFLRVKYWPAIDAFVAYPIDLQCRNLVLYILRDFYPEEWKNGREFNMYAVGERYPCNERLHKKDGRMYKYFDMEDAIIFSDDPDWYHSPKRH